MTSQIIAVRAEEIDALHGLGPLALAIYVHLRLWMDYGTGIVGKTRPVSLGMLAAHCEAHTAKGRGTHVEQPSTQAIRTALDRLQRAGLLRRLPGDRLSFSMPMAQRAPARPFQTQHEVNADLSTEPNTGKAAPMLEDTTERNTEKACGVRPNSTHIMYQVNQNPTARPAAAVDKSAGPSYAGIAQTLAQAWFPDGATPKAKGGFAEWARATPPASAEESRLLAIGRQKGVNPRPGESWSEFAARLFKRPQPAAHAH